MSKKTILYSGFVLSVFIIMSLFIDSISPKDRTETVLVSTKYRILLFCKKNQKYPSKLTELPKRKGYNNSFLDGSGNNILYEVNDNIVTLIGKINSNNRNESKKSITFKCKF